jgi:spore coat polysaccharide biosynthesis protein SpsF
MATTGFLITARCGSTRLPRKHLRHSCGVPILDVLIRRIHAAFRDEIVRGDVAVVIATSEEPENQAFEELAGVQVFYGSPDNVPLRHLQTADGLGLDAMVAIDGDDMYCSMRAVRAIMERLQAGASYVVTRGLPFGMNTQGYSTAFLRASLERRHGQVLETGWGHIFDPAAMETLHFDDITADERLRFTLDYAEDFEFFDKLTIALADDVATASDAQIVGRVLDDRLWQLNSGVAEQYWKNFYALQDAERQLTRGK